MKPEDPRRSPTTAPVVKAGQIWKGDMSNSFWKILEMKDGIVTRFQLVDSKGIGLVGRHAFLRDEAAERIMPWREMKTLVADPGAEAP